MQKSQNARNYIDMDEFHQLYSESVAFVPFEARPKEVYIKQQVSQDHIRVERSLQRTKLRARSLSLEKERKNLFSADHVQRWRGKKVGPMIDENTSAPSFVYQYLNESKIRDASLDQLKSEIISGLIEQFEKIAFIVNPQRMEAEALVNGLNWYIQKAVDEYSKTMIASVLKTFDKSQISEEIILTKAKLQRYEYLVTNAMKTDQNEVKQLFDLTMCSKDFAASQGWIPFPESFNVHNGSQTPETNTKQTRNAFTYDQLQQHNKELSEQIKQLEYRLEEYRSSLQQTRISALKEIQVLKSQLLLKDQQSLTKDKIRKYTRHLKVQYFNPFEGIDKEKAEIMESCIKNITKEAQIEYAIISDQLDNAIKKIDIYKRLIPRDYSLVDTPLDEIMACVALIEPHAYTAWKAFLNAYPRNHFSTLILEYAENDANNEEGSSLMQIVEDWLGRIRVKQMETIEEIRGRIYTLDARNRELVNQHQHERDQFTKMIQKIEQNAKEAKQKFEALVDQKHQLIEQRQFQQLNEKVRRKKDRIRRLRSITMNFEVRRLIQKWKLVTTMGKYAEQLQRGVLDGETLKDFLVRDMKKIFFQDDILRLQNSIASYKQRIKDQDETYKEMAETNYELRKRCNQLQLEKDDVITQNDNLSVLLSDQEYAREMLNIERLNAIEERKTAEFKLAGVLNQLSSACKKVEELEERYGLKITNEPKKKFTLKQDKFQQAQKLIEFYNFEMKSLELRLYGKMQLEKRCILTGSDGQKVPVGVQTELQSIGRHVELVYKTGTRYKVGQYDLPKLEVEVQTNIGFDDFEYMQKATEMQERLQKSDKRVMDATELQKIKSAAYRKILEAEASQRKQLADAELQFTEVSKELKHANTVPLDRPPFVQNNKIWQKKNPITAIEQLEIEPELNSDLPPDPILNDSKQRQRRRVIELQETQEAVQVSAQVTVDESAMSMIELRSKLDSTAFAKQNAQLNSQLLQSLQKKQYEYFQQSKMESDHCDNTYVQTNDYLTSLQHQQMDALQSLAQQKNAIDCFEMYAEIITVLKELDPSLFKMAINIVKSSFPSVQLLPASLLSRLYPKLVPDVFTRLWEDKGNSKEKVAKLQNTTSKEWEERLQDQKLLENKSKRKRTTSKKHSKMPSTVQTQLEVKHTIQDFGNVNLQVSETITLEKPHSESVSQLANNQSEKEVSKLPDMRGYSSSEAIPQLCPVKEQMKSQSVSKRHHQRILSEEGAPKEISTYRQSNSRERISQKSAQKLLLSQELPTSVQSHKIQETVFPLTKLDLTRNIQTFSPVFSSQDVATSTIELRIKSKYKEQDTALTQDDLDRISSMKNQIKLKNSSNILSKQQAGSATNTLTCQNNAQRPIATSVSKLKPLMPARDVVEEVQEQPAARRLHKRQRPITSKPRTNTQNPFTAITRQNKDSNAGFALSNNPSELDTMRFGSRPTILNKDHVVKSRVSAGGGFMQGIATQRQKAHLRDNISDTTLSTVMPKAEVQIKEFNTGLSKPLATQWYKKDQTETANEYVRRLKQESKKRPNTASMNSKRNHTQNEPVSELASDTANKTLRFADGQSNSLKIQGLNARRYSKQQEVPQFERTMRNINSGSSFGDNVIYNNKPVRTEHNSNRGPTIFQNQALLNSSNVLQKKLLEEKVPYKLYQ